MDAITRKIVVILSLDVLVDWKIVHDLKLGGICWWGNLASLLLAEMACRGEGNLKALTSESLSREYKIKNIIVWYIVVGNNKKAKKIVLIVSEYSAKK